MRGPRQGVRAVRVARGDLRASRKRVSSRQAKRRMTATRASLWNLPLATSRLGRRAGGGWQTGRPCRASGAAGRARRASSECRAVGRNRGRREPARVARRPSEPSSGMAAQRQAALSGPQPGMDWIISARRASTASAARQVCRSRSQAARAACKLASGLVKRRAACGLSAAVSLRRVPSCSISLRRATSKSWRSCRLSACGGVACKSARRPKRASMVASTRSFLASWPSASAKRRERKGLTRTVSKPAAARHWCSWRW